MFNKVIEWDLVGVNVYDFRNWLMDEKYNKIDDCFFGGGLGMII